MVILRDRESVCERASERERERERERESERHPVQSFFTWRAPFKNTHPSGHQGTKRELNMSKPKLITTIVTSNNTTAITCLLLMSRIFFSNAKPNCHVSVRVRKKVREREGREER